MLSEQLKSRLRQMSTEQLEEMLSLDMLSEDGIGESFSSAIVDVLEERAIKNGVPAVDVDAKWKDFCENYLPGAENGSLYLDDEELEQPDEEITSNAGLLEQNDSLGKARNPKRKPLRVLLKVAGTAAAMVMLFFSCIGIANAAGYDAWNTVASWTEDIFTFRERGGNLEVSVLTSHEPDGSGSYASLQDALDAYGITAPIAPKWIPKGYNAESVTAVTTESGVNISAIYISQEGQSETDIPKGIEVNVVFDLSATMDYKIQNDEGNPEVYDKNGVEHYLVTNTSDIIAVWRQGSCKCGVSSNGVGIKDLKTIIDSIYWRY